MAVKGDPAIKLFGQMIPVLISRGDEESKGQGEKDLQNEEASEHDQESSDSQEKFELSTSLTSEISTPESADKEVAAINCLKSGEEIDDQGQTEEKKIKKPDQILPCPRCNSMETKFCYFNNYNVNQPRHFCKKCQRYWTAGGTMRNVPVGAGRRKNKSSTSHYRQIIMSSSSLQAIPESISYPPKPSSTVLSFGSDTPFCDPAASVLNLADRSTSHCNLNGFHQMVEKVALPSRPADTGDEHCNGPSASSPNSKMLTNTDAQSDKVTQTCAVTPCINGSLWPYPWIPSLHCPPGYPPIPIYPAAVYWNCTVSSEASPVPWLPPESSPLVNGQPQDTRPGADPALCKYPRDGILQKYSNTRERQNDDEQDNQERSIWVPKTLRIDDPEGAARSSLWGLFGVKKVKTEELSSSGLSKECQPKIDIKNHTMDASEVLRANPAALARSLNFHESM